MKKNPILSKSISSLLILGSFSALPAAHAANVWDGGGTSDVWSDVLNWDNNAFPGYGTLTFAGSTRTTNIVDANINMSMLLWTGASAWTLNNSGGAVISLFDNGGTQAKIENQSTGSVTLNAPITFAATVGAAWGEINAVNGDITFGSGGTLTVNGSNVNGIKMFGSGHTTTFNSTVNATGKWFATTGATAATIAVGGAFTSGDLYIMNGSTLRLDSAGSIATTGLRLGGDFGTTLTQNLALGATFQLAALTGGQTFAGNINSVTGNTSNALLVDSLNTSGTNTLSGAVFLDSPLRMQVAAGGTLAATGVVSNASSLTKQGLGTLTLSNTNTYTGGTALSAGTLNVNSAGAIGNTTAGALTITGGTLDNNSAGAVLTTTAKALAINADFNFTGTQNLSFNLGTATIGGAAGTRTINVAGGTLAVGLLNSGAGIGLTKTGAGTLMMGASTLANTSTINGTLDIQAGKIQMGSDFTVTGLTGSGTIENGGTASKWFFVNSAANNTFSGTIQNNPSSPTTIRLGLVKSGVGTLTLSGTNNFADNFEVRGGAVTITGTSSTGYTGGGQASIGDVANTNGVLNINGGTLNANKTTSPSLVVGAGANARGFLNMTSGTINTMNQFNLGSGSVATTSRSYGAFTMSGGTLNSGSWLVVGANFDRDVINQSGGTINVLANRMTIGAGGVESLGVVNVSGTGTLNSIGGIFLGENGQGIINLSGSGTVNSGTNTMQFAGNATSTAGTLNLNGGTLAAGSITKGTSNAAGVYRINFNGGTVKANTTSTTFLANLALTTGYVNGGGAIFDTNTFDDTVAMPLLAPTGQGLSAIAVATGGAGYIDTPVVTITGGTGTGAQAVAIVSGGVVTGFTITNPGVGYTAGDVLTPTLFGGGATTAATTGTITLAANVSGGLTKNGAGTLTLSGASSYTGNVVVNTGTLAGAFTNIGNPTTSAFGNATIAGRTITVASGATIRLTANDSFGNQLATAANLPALIINGTLSATAYNQIGALTLNGATLTGSNGTGTALYQNFQFLGDVTIGGSAPSFITSTVAAGIDGHHLNTSTTFNVADVTGSAATDLTVSAHLRDRSNNYGNTAGALVKTGAGKMELTGANVYTGSTSVTNGTLQLSGTGAVNSSSGITVNGAAAKFVQNSSVSVSPTVTLTLGTIDGTGTINTVNAAAGTVIANGDGGTGVLTIGTLTHGSPATYNLTTASTSPVLVTTTLTTNGGIITINANNASWTNGLDYNLVSYTTLNGTLADFNKGTVTNLGARQSATLTNPAGFIALTIAGDLPVWTGLQSGNWTTSIIGGSSNWKLQTGATVTDFIVNDTVLFDDTITTGTRAVTISTANVNPISTTFNNTANNYTLSGAFGIASGSLTKTGAGSVTLGTANTYTGATTVSNGTLILTGSLGNTAVTVAGPATLNLQAAGAISQNTVTVNGTITQTVANALSGTAALVLNNGATLGTANNHSGGTTLNSGTLLLNNATAIGTGTFTLSGGTIDNTSGNSITLTSNNAQIWSGGGALNFTGTNALSLGSGAVALGADASAGTFTATNNSGLGGTSLAVAGPITSGTGGAAGVKTLNISGVGSTVLSGNITTGAAMGLVVNDNVPGTLTLSGAASAITTLNINGGAGSIVELFAGNLGVANGGASIVQSTTGGTINGTGGGAIVLNSANGDFGTAGGTTLTVNAKISGGNAVDFWNANGGAGFGSVVLAGANTYTGATNVQNIRLVVPAGGAINALNTAGIGQITVGDNNVAQALLVVSGGTINATKATSPSLAVGSVAGAVGAISMTSGTINTTSEFHLGRGAGGYGAFTMSGGAVNSGNWFVVGLNNDRAVFNQSGGSLAVATNRMTIGAGGAGSIGVVNQSGGALTSAAGANTGIFVGENGTGTYTLSGTGAITLNTNGTVNSGTVQFAGNPTSLAGNFNLNGGTVTAFGVTKGASTAGGVYAFNFNGGTLKANANNAAFFAALANTSAYVNSGGAVIDDGGFAVAAAQPLLAPPNSGVTSIAVSGGTGYLGTPLVQITGDGTGATAIANLDGSGNITGITMTNFGVNYTTASAALLGGGGTGATIGAIGFTPNVSGGLTKNGTGTLTLSGANTYTGLTTVNNGTLALSGGTAIADVGAVSLANVPGATLLLNASETIGSLAGGGVLGGTVSLGANTLTTGDAGTTTFAGALSGAGGQVVKQGAGTFNITGAQTYAGLTTTGGTTNIYTALGTGTSTLTANATTNFYASQTLASLTIADGVEVTFGDGLLFADEPVKFGGAPALVPEPGSLGLLMVGALGLLARRRRKQPGL